MNRFVLCGQKTQIQKPKHTNPHTHTHLTNDSMFSSKSRRRETALAFVNNLN